MFFGVQLGGEQTFGRVFLTNGRLMFFRGQLGGEQTFGRVFVPNGQLMFYGGHRQVDALFGALSPFLWWQMCAHDQHFDDLLFSEPSPIHVDTLVFSLFVMYFRFGGIVIACTMYVCTLLILSCLPLLTMTIC